MPDEEADLSRKLHPFWMTVALMTALVLPALGQVNTVVLCLPGFPGSTTQAQPYVDQMLRYLETKLGQPPQSISGTYIPDGAAGTERITRTKPELALVGPSIYAGQHKALKMKVVAKVSIDGRGEETYSVLTRLDGPKELSELKGKKLIGAVVNDSRFVVRVLLDGRLPLDSVILETQKRPLKALRQVLSGKADAAIVDRAVVEHLPSLDFAKDLKIIHTSKPIPAPAVVVIGGDKSRTEKLKKALVGLCETAEGRDLCRALTISAIRAASAADYRQLLEQYTGRSEK